jgi:hypothetical protein
MFFYYFEMKIGNKSSLQVQFKFQNELSKFGFGKIWIDNNFLGTEKDLIPLFHLISILQEFKDSEELEENLKNLNKIQLFDYIKNDSTELKDKYLVRGSTFTDDFQMYSFKRNGKIYVLWQILNRNYFEDLKDYKTDLIEKTINSDELNTVINELAAIFKTIP